MNNYYKFLCLPPTAGLTEIQNQLKLAAQSGKVPIEILHEIRDTLYNSEKRRAYDAALRQADPATWQPIDNAAGYSRDQHRIYYCERPLPRSTDTASWQYLAHGYSRDRNRVYYWEKILPQADPASWRHLHDSFSKDLRHVYYGTRIIPRENPTDWNTERARTTDVMRVMRHIAQAQADDTVA